uniref:Uncharacterized protein n=1 Tax=Parascaris univalens TaxID=6257 RepID=A0A915A1E3_PARUN
MLRNFIEDCMRVPTSDIANASRKASSFRSRSPSIRPVFKDKRSYELDVQHIVRGLLKRAREERDDPKFVGRHESSTEECPNLFTATSVESELQSEENFEKEIDIDPDDASTSVEKKDDRMENITDRSSTHSLTVTVSIFPRLFHFLLNIMHNFPSSQKFSNGTLL